MLDVARIRADFPILSRPVAGGKPLVYLDNAATTQKPRQVIEAIARYYERTNANVHRAIHDLGEQATEQYEEARAKVARFIGAAEPAEIVFTRNASEALNLVAYAWARTRLGPGDEIVTSVMEHHSNLIPWQQVARMTGATVRFVGITPDGRLDLDDYRAALAGGRVKLVALTQASNVLGTINPVEELTRLAHQAGALMVVDGAQSVPHMPVDVRAIGCDALAFSGHKMLGPMGIGVLYGKRGLLEAMDPFLFGGEMISDVSLDEARWNEIPWKFEAGTPNVAGAIGLAAAIDYLTAIGMDQVFEHDQRLAGYALERLTAIDGLDVYGPGLPRTGLVAFNMDDVHPHDVATILNDNGVAVRAGHHCAQPLTNHLGVAATNRASFYIYNTEREIDALVRAIERTREFFGHVAI